MWMCPRNFSSKDIEMIDHECQKAKHLTKASYRHLPRSCIEELGTQHADLKHRQCWKNALKYLAMEKLRGPDHGLWRVWKRISSNRAARSVFSFSNANPIPCPEDRSLRPWWGYVWNCKASGSPGKKCWVGRKWDCGGRSVIGNLQNILKKANDIATCNGAT